MKPIFVAASCLIAGSLAYDNGVGKLPILGWTTWCSKDICGLRDHCSEPFIKRRIDALHDEGLYDKGYNYVLLDDCWSDDERDANGNLQPEPLRFPSGMAALADYAHERGVKIGLYTDVGDETCKKGRPGSYGHYEQDAAQMAAWNIDMVKADNCHIPAGESSKDLYHQYSAALNATGHPMLFAMCNWGNDNIVEEAWAKEISHMYRIQMDHLPLWHWPPTGAGSGFGQGTSDIIEYMAYLSDLGAKQEEYAIMDPDFLMTLFPFSMTFTDSRTEMSFWCLFSSPLLVSTEILNLDEDKAIILMNKEVLAIDQDELLATPKRISKSDLNGGQVWTKQLSGGDYAVILYNPGSGFMGKYHDINIGFTWDELGWDRSARVSVRDLWKGEDLGVLFFGYADKVEARDVRMLRVKKM